MPSGTDQVNFRNETDIMLILGANAFALVLLAICWGAYDVLF